MPCPANKERTINQMCVSPTARRAAKSRLPTSASTSTWAVMLTLTLLVQPSTAPLSSATRAGSPVTRWPLTLPSPRCPRATLPSATRQETSSCTQMCKFIRLCARICLKVNMHARSITLHVVAQLHHSHIHTGTCWSSHLLERSLRETHFFCEKLDSSSVTSPPTLFSNDGSEFGGSIYQKVSDKLETAVNLAWTAGSNSTRFGIAAKYQLDKDATISVSHDNFRGMSQIKCCWLITIDGTFCFLTLF